MFLKQCENLLPKKRTDGVALKTSVFEKQLSGLRGFRKLPIFSKFILGALAVLYFSAYQPILTVPPLGQMPVYAAETQEQDISAGALSQPFALPHPGYITTHFSSFHPGIDIATGLGMPIHPIADGKVIKVVFGFIDLGHYVTVEHAQGFQSTYGHMGNIFVKVGDNVTQSSILGEVGLTGHTTGPHTHLEITHNGQYVDPEKLLPVLPDWPESAGEGPHGQGDVTITPTPTPTPTPAVTLQKITENTAKAEIINLKTLIRPQVKTEPFPTVNGGISPKEKVLFSDYFTF